MYRSDWELSIYNRQHIAELAGACQDVPQIDQGTGGSPHLLTQLRHRLGIGLIQIGHALAGDDALRGLAMPPSHSAPWGQLGS